MLHSSVWLKNRNIKTFKRKCFLTRKKEFYSLIHKYLSPDRRKLNNSKKESFKQLNRLQENCNNNKELKNSS